MIQKHLLANWRRLCSRTHVNSFLPALACVFFGRADGLMRHFFPLCSCWMSVETHLLYAVHGPIVAALLVSEEEIQGNKGLSDPTAKS